MAEKTLPLTPAMRAALIENERGHARQLVPATLVVALAAVVSAGLALSGLLFTQEAAFFTVLVCIVIGGLALFYLVRALFARALMRDARRRTTYTRYVGPLRAALKQARTPAAGGGTYSTDYYTLWAGEDLTLGKATDISADDFAALTAISHGRVAIIAGTVLAVWNDDGDCLYHRPSYDPAADTALGQP